MSGSGSNELRRSALEAARDARKEVAALMRSVEDEHPELASSLSEVVATLFSAEVGDHEKIHRCLDRANASLRELVEQDRWQTREVVAKGLSRALALVYPALTALARSLGKELREESTAPFLLTSSRVKSNPPPDDGERRRALRAELEVEIGLEGDNRFYTGTTGDISTGGLFVATDTPLIVGTELVLSFVLPDGYRVAADATVAWVRAPRYRPDELPAGMGVRFEAITQVDRRAVEHFLEHKPPFHYGD